MDKLGKRDHGTEIAKHLFPELQLEPQGGWCDQAGIDAYDRAGNSIQIKFDGGIHKNIYHEVYEKTANRPEQNWHPAFGKVHSYIFTWETSSIEYAIKIPVDIIAKAERGKSLTSIYPNSGADTSMGFLIPLSELKGKYELRRHFKKR